MTMEELSTRLERVERQNRRMRAVGAVGLVLALAVAAMGQAGAPAKVVQAEKFEVVDKDGKASIEIGVFGDTPSVRVLDREGHRRAEVGLANGVAPFVTLRDEKEKVRMDHRVQEGVTASSLMDSGGRLRAGVGVAPDGTGGFRLDGEDGKLRALLTETRVGKNGGLGLYDAKGRMRITLAPAPLPAASDEGASLGIIDAQGHSRASVGVKPDGSPFLVLSDEVGKDLFRKP